MAACGGTGNSPVLLNVAGQWAGLATGASGDLEIQLLLEQDEHGVITASLSIPTIPDLDSATGWGRVEGGSVSIAMTDKSRRGVYLTGKIDAIGAELTGWIALADNPSAIAFSVFKQ